jgi:cell division septation protein DedD
MIAGALVGAIAVGGVLAYGYKTFGGRGDGKTPVIRADTAPAKTRPTDPGGKEVAHTDKKFINRLGDDKPGEARSETATLGDTDSGGPRKVTTLVVNRDGSMAAPNPVVSQGSAINGSGVPGMLIEGLNSGPARPQLRGTASSEGRVTASSETQAPTPQAVPQKPQVIAKASAAPEAPPRPTKKPAEREEPEASPSKTAVASAPPPQPATGANGYVPVLASQKSRMDALKAFADIQQKYGDALQNGTPDVREVNLGEKGVWHRLMLGPPGSRESAKTVCTQLKALGYSGCWVTAY